MSAQCDVPRSYQPYLILAHLMDTCTALFDFCTGEKSVLQNIFWNLKSYQWGSMTQCAPRSGKIRFFSLQFKKVEDGSNLSVVVPPWIEQIAIQQTVGTTGSNQEHKTIADNTDRLGSAPCIRANVCHSFCYSVLYPRICCLSLRKCIKLHLRLNSKTFSNILNDWRKETAH